MARKWCAPLNRASGDLHRRENVGSVARGDALRKHLEKQMQLLKTLWLDESGQDTAEYALLLLMIALALITAVTGFRTAIANAFSRATAQLNSTT
jgi:Flp pilus assembly pilin Flp